MANILYLRYLSRALSRPAPTVGGCENQLIGLIRNLDKTSYRPTVVCSHAGEFSSKLESFGIPVHISHMPGWRKARSRLSRRLSAMRLTKMAREHHIDLIHTADLWSNYYAWQVGRSLDIPIISHVRSVLDPERVHKYLFDKFDRIIAISWRMKESLISGGVPSDKIEVIYDGVDTSIFKPQGEESNVLRRDYPLREHLVGMVGRIEHFKRQKEFVRAIAQVLKVRQDVSFLLIGEPEIPDSDYLREVKQSIEKYGISEHVILTGYRRDMPEVLRSLDILVTLSGGSIMMEAMACGIPVIMASAANPADLRIVRDGETGIVVPYDDIDSVSKAILRLLDDGETRREMGKAGRARVEELYDMRKIAESTEAVYAKILSKRSEP